LKFRKNPSEIEAVQFTGDINAPDIPEHVKLREVDGRFEIFNTLHDSWILIKPNDYFRTDIVGDSYPIDLAYMNTNYTLESSEPVEIDPLFKLNVESLVFADVSNGDKVPIGLIQTACILVNANSTVPTVTLHRLKDDLVTLYASVWYVSDIYKMEDGTGHVIEVFQ